MGPSWLVGVAWLACGRDLADSYVGPRWLVGVAWLACGRDLADSYVRPRWLVGVAWLACGRDLADSYLGPELTDLRSPALYSVACTAPLAILQTGTPPLRSKPSSCSTLADQILGVATCAKCLSASQVS